MVTNQALNVLLVLTIISVSSFKQMVYQRKLPSLNMPRLGIVDCGGGHFRGVDVGVDCEATIFRAPQVFGLLLGPPYEEDVLGEVMVV